MKDKTIKLNSEPQEGQYIVIWISDGELWSETIKREGGKVSVYDPVNDQWRAREESFFVYLEGCEFYRIKKRIEYISKGQSFKSENGTIYILAYFPSSHRFSLVGKDGEIWCSGAYFRDEMIEVLNKNDFELVLDK